MSRGNAVFGLTSNKTVSDTSPTSRVLQAEIHIDGDGDARRVINGTETTLPGDSDWVRPLGDWTSYYVKVDHVSYVNQLDAVAGGDSLSTWLPLTSDRSWTWITDASPSVGSQSWNVTLTIASDSGGSNVVCGPINVELQVEYAP